MSSSSSHLSPRQHQQQKLQAQLSHHHCHNLNGHHQVAHPAVLPGETSSCEEQALMPNNVAPGRQFMVGTNQTIINMANSNPPSTTKSAAVSASTIPRDLVEPSAYNSESALLTPAHQHQSKPDLEAGATTTTNNRPSDQTATMPPPSDSQHRNQQPSTPSHQQKQLQQHSSCNVLSMVNPDTRTHVVGELYDTERSYVESLQILVEKYMKPLKSLENKSLIESNLVDEIFFTVPEILEHHERFLSALQERLSDDWDSSQVIGNVFIEFTKQQIIDTYTKFINNWKNARHAIKVASQAKPAFERFLEAMSREHRNKLTLDALLIMPVQRIPRYELLIKELIKHTPHDHPDHGLLIEAQKEIHELALEIDRAEKEMMHQEQLKDLETLIEGHVELQHPQRDFIRYDLVTISASTLTVAKKERVLFLFCDLLIMASIKKKVSRRSNLQVAFSNSDHDISLLEGNKFKLILRVSLDQVEIKCDNNEQTQLWQQQHQQHYHEQQLIALAQRKKLIQSRKRELESDMFVLQQMEHLSSQLAHADKINLCSDIGESMEKIRLKLINLEQQTNECQNYVEQQQQLSLKNSAQLAQDLSTIQSPVKQQIHGIHQSGSNSLTVNLLRDSHSSQQMQSSSSVGVDQEHSSRQNTDASLEFMINNNVTTSKEVSGANLNSPMQLEHDLSATNTINSTTIEQQQLTSSINCESLVVSFPSRDRRQAFLHAFLEAKQVRLIRRQQQQHQKIFNSSISLRLSQPDHPLMKSRSIASDMRRNRLQHQDEMLNIRSSYPPGDHTDGRHDDRNSSAPCAGMIVHQMSAPLCINAPDDNQLTATHCPSCSSNCTSSDRCHRRQHNNHHHHHHQLMHQPASHPALLHTICCHESHEDTINHNPVGNNSDHMLADRDVETVTTDQQNNYAGFINQGAGTMLTDKRVGLDDESMISSLRNDLDKCNQINDQILMLKFVPRFLTSLPLNFLNTQHPALQLTCSIPAKFNLDDKQIHQSTGDAANRFRSHTVNDNRGQLWLCMSNGYVSHISLIEFFVDKMEARCNFEQMNPGHYIRTMVKAGGDICKSQINCAAQVDWCQADETRPNDSDHFKKDHVSSVKERGQHQVVPTAPKLYVKPKSSPINIERKNSCDQSSSIHAQQISSSTPARHNDLLIPTNSTNLSLSITEIKHSNLRRNNNSARTRHSREPPVDSSTGIWTSRCKPIPHHHHHHQSQLQRYRDPSRQAHLQCNHNGRPGHRGVCQLTGTFGHQQHPHHTHSHNHGHHNHSHQVYNYKHHTVPLVELRRAFERQNKLSLSDRDRLSPPSGPYRGSSHLAPPANTPSHTETGSIESVDASTLGHTRNRSKLARSITPPGRYKSTSNKSLRSARQLRHQASLKTSSILAKLVSSAGMGSSYLKRSSTTRVNSGGKPLSDADDNYINSDQQHEVSSKQDSTKAVNNQLDTNPNLLSATNLNTNSNNESIVSPLSSASSLNSTNSSITVNSVCASSPNRGSCALLNLPHWSSTTCCTIRNESTQGAMNSEEELSILGDELSDGAESCLRSRSATVPCRAYCEQSNSVDYDNVQDELSANWSKCCNLEGKSACDPYHVSEIIDDSDNETRKHNDRGSDLIGGAINTTTNTISIDKQTSLWLGCDDGSLIIIDCLRPNNQTCKDCNIGPGQNKHSELKLGSSINDIKNHLDKLVFVALADGRLVIFKRKIDDKGTPGKWQLTNPQIMVVTKEVSSSTSRLCLVDANHLWYSYGCNIYILNVPTLSIETTIRTPTGGKSTMLDMETIGINNMHAVTQLDGVWVSLKGSPLIQFYDSRDHKVLLEFNSLEPINRILSCGDEILRQHKTACLGTTSLLSIYNEAEDSNSLFIGTTAGLILVLTMSRSQLQRQVESQTLAWNPQVISLRHGHSSAVKFLHLIQLMRISSEQNPNSVVDKKNINHDINTYDDTISRENQFNSTSRGAAGGTTSLSSGSLCLVSGGAGIDLYGPDDKQQSLQHLSTEDDCLSQLILWDI